MDIPWQLCRTIGPLLSQRFPLASAKAQPRALVSQNFSRTAIFVVYFSIFQITMVNFCKF